MAAHLLKLRTYSADVTWYYRDGDGPMNLTYNPIEKINSVMGLVPEGQKEIWSPVGRGGKAISEHCCPLPSMTTIRTLLAVYSGCMTPAV